MTQAKTEAELHVLVIGAKSLGDLVPAQVDGNDVQITRSEGRGMPKKLPESVPDVVLIDAKHATGADNIERILRHYGALPVPVIVVGKDRSVETIVECMSRGAKDFVVASDAEKKLPAKLLKQAEGHKLLARVKRLSEIYQKGGRLCGMVGISPAMHRIYATVKSIADTDATVLISGESGTGKELVARAIHTLSPRNSGRFVPVNCAAIPKDLLESELFGHEKGAFTGAERQHIGSCERADHGTLFLDEISEMHMGLQSKMLRFLQDHTFTRVGGGEDIKVNTRVIAATNKDPLEQVKEGNLRDDLYYRLNVVPIVVPPLRERPEDIPVLAEYYMEEMREKYLKYFIGFSVDAVRILLCYDWPGNVRELANTIERIVVLATEDRITADLFPEPMREAARTGQVPSLAVEEALACIEGALQAAPAEADADEVLPFEEVERRTILSAIKKCNGDISKASRKLGLSRATLYRKLDKYGVR